MNSASPTSHGKGILKGQVLSLLIFIRNFNIMAEYTFNGREDAATCSHLRNGETCRVVGVGNSMTPILKSRQAVICSPIKDNTVISKKSIVLCKVKGRYYLHLVHGIRKTKDKEEYLIGNNHGHMNGWVQRKNIFGIVSEIL